MIYQNNFFWFETNKYDNLNYLSYYFFNPVKIIKLIHPDQLNLFFAELENLTKKYYVAGFLSYELGYLFEEIFDYKKSTQFPFALFCAYEKPIIFNHKTGKFVSGRFIRPDASQNYNLQNLRLNISKKEYLQKIEKIKNYIYEGDIFQANFTVKYKFDFSGSALALYRDLKNKQRVAYNVFAKFGDYYILSLSPELFFYKNKNYIKVKPMKGTISRGRNIYEDRKRVEFLYNDEKNQSENVMIVDLLRNDLGKISEYGSVKVTKLFEIEKYDTLFQMTSTIVSKLKRYTTLYDLIKNIFPSGSVTGAPKIRSMEIIKELEKEERKIYTGSIGFFTPDGKARFNVAIRTILIHKNVGEMGIGGGIVYDSSSESEFEEAKLKALFLIKKPVREFSLIETILYDKSFKYLNLHLKRLKESAEYFEYKFNKKKILLKLKEISYKLNEGKYKVRILLNRAGDIKLSYEKINDISEKLKITISKYRTDSNNIFYFHKTTNRDLYDSELKKARRQGFFDVIFLNERDDITEGAITNIYIRKNGIFYTPSLDCGLLNGIIRQIMIKKHKIKEKVLKLDDLKQADEIYISNSIIGFKRAYLF